jgi:hypothetical protein
VYLFDQWRSRVCGKTEISHPLLLSANSFGLSLTHSARHVILVAAKTAGGIFSALKLAKQNF